MDVPCSLSHGTELVVKKHQHQDKGHVQILVLDTRYPLWMGDERSHRSAYLNGAVSYQPALGMTR